MTMCPPQLWSSEELSRAFVENTPALVCVVDGCGRLVLANPALQRFTGRSAVELIGRRFWDVYVVEEDVELARGALAHAMATGQSFAYEGDWLAEDGRRRRVAMNNNVLVDDTGRPYAIACIGVDVTEQRQLESRLHERAHTDVLTGIANRGALFEALGRRLDDPDGGGCGLLFCDLDRFKAVNDEYGHVTGDWLLIEVARRLLSVAGPEDVVARFGGDEFVVLTPDADPAALSALASRIEARMREAFTGPAGPLDVGISIGAAVGRPGDTADELVARADRGMYGAKSHRRPGAGASVVGESSPC